jgi:hypothetical protein
MAKHLYFVVLYRGQWTISFQDKRYGPFLGLNDAISSAIDVAHRDGSEGHDARVILQRHGQFQLEWTYGKDPYLPRD